jgi:subtilisin family serine protease
MREKHIVLRSLGSGTRDVFRGGVQVEGSEGRAAGELKVDIEEIERRDIPKLVRDRDVVAVAPAIPFKLIAPVEHSNDVQALADNIAWGVQAVGADSSPFTGDGVIVCVLDTGIDASHAAFQGVELVQKNFTNEADGDVHGHGTHCAGTIFGRSTAGTRIGVAPGVKKALIGKVLGAQGGGSEQILKAIQWAVESGANVISMSLGMDFPGLVAQLVQEREFPIELATSRALEAYRANVVLFERLATLVRAQGAFGAGTVIIAAAGNESRRDQNPDFEIAVAPPAAAEGIVSVAALGRGANGFVVAPFSNTGANVAAPGVQIVSAKLGGGLAAMSGTSMATPHVAGIAALWAERIGKMGGSLGQQLTARLIASGIAQGFAAGFDPADVGAGLVRAPRD